eukprot:TRINITY_DN8639_c0_g1_i1.p1 TRINITY_DN8639_c0_g1~~TRINITY_DN8639_c0_g1_i1.p1  ORF type:complete len:185 (-),score=15.51 TRINITY_DN8639_c0_g1_i1:134-688(-)
MSYQPVQQQPTGYYQNTQPGYSGQPVYVQPGYGQPNVGYAQPTYTTATTVQVAHPNFSRQFMIFFMIHLIYAIIAAVVSYFWYSWIVFTLSVLEFSFVVRYAIIRSKFLPDLPLYPFFILLGLAVLRMGLCISFTIMIFSTTDLDVVLTGLNIYYAAIAISFLSSIGWFFVWLTTRNITQANVH